MKEYTFDLPLLQGPRGIDENTRVLYGTQVIKKGLAKGHNLEIDDETLDTIVRLGNAAPDGVKVRWGHPDMCNPGIGTTMGRRRNFRRDGDYVTADLYLSDAAPPEAVRHLLALAKSDPDLIGSSVVIEADTLEREGRDPDGDPLLPLIRPTALRAVDLVDEPAAGDGLFGAPIEGISLSSREMLGLRKAMSNADFVRRGLDVLAHQARILGLDVGAAPFAAPAAAPVNDAAAERERVKFIMGKCNGKPHLQQDSKVWPGGLMNFAIDTGMDRVAFLEALIQISENNAWLEALHEASDEIGVMHAEMYEGPIGPMVPHGTLEASMRARFLKLGYTDAQATAMAREAATNEG